jgi:hypothetical protein
MGTEDRLTEVAVKIDAEWAARVVRFDFSDLELEDDEEL